MSVGTLAGIMEKVRATGKPFNLFLRLDHHILFDCDSEAAENYLMSLYSQGILPLTVCWRTAGRGHVAWLYRPPQEIQVKSVAESTNDLHLGIRTGRRQCCTIPPSSFGDHHYIWVRSPWDVEVAELPAAALVQITEHLASNPKAKETKKAKGGGRIKGSRKPQKRQPGSSRRIYEGERDDFLFRRACGMRGRGMEREAIETDLQELNRAQCFPPLSSDDVSRISRSAAKYPAGSYRPGFLPLLKLTYAQVITALEELGARTKWIRWGALAKKLQAMTGIAGSVLCPPVSIPTIKRILGRMRSLGLISYRQLGRSGWYKLPATGRKEG